MGTWSVSTSGENYIMEYSNGFKRSIRKSQVTKTSQGAIVTYASSQSPNLTLAETNYAIQSYSFSAKFSAVSSLDLTGCFLDSNNNDCATLINWGDGTIDSNLTHTYSISGDYVVSVACEDAVEIMTNKNSLTEFYYTVASGLQSLILNDNQIVNFNPSIALPSTLQLIELGDNQIVDFNPSIALPIGLQSLELGGNQIVDFNPSIALPSGLQSLDLSGNQMTIAGYTASETWANAQPSFTSSCNVYFTNNIDSVSGVDLETILISKNCTISV